MVSVAFSRINSQIDNKTPLVDNSEANAGLDDTPIMSGSNDWTKRRVDQANTALNSSLPRQFFSNVEFDRIASAQEATDDGDIDKARTMVMNEYKQTCSKPQLKNSNHTSLQELPDMLRDADTDLYEPQCVMLNSSKKSNKKKQYIRSNTKLMKETFPNATEDQIFNILRDFDGDLAKACDFLVTELQEQKNISNRKDDQDFDYHNDNSPSINKFESLHGTMESSPTPQSTSVNHNFLQEFFPQLDMATIIKALEQTNNNVDECTNLLMSWTAGEEEIKSQKQTMKDRELDSNSPEYKVNSLSEIFSHIDSKIIAKVLKESEFDMTRASESLLNHDIIEKFERDLKIQENSEAFAKFKTMNMKKDAWDHANDKILGLVDLLGIDKRIIKTHYHKNSGRSVLTIVDVIYNLRIEIEEKEKEEKRKTLKLQNEAWKSLQLKSIPKDGELRLQHDKSSDSSQTKVLVPKGGRVQTVSSITKPKYNNLTKSNEKSKTDDSKSHYYYNPNTLEVEELGSLVYEDPNLVSISWEFYKESLTFFKGDVSKVLSLALFIVENDGSSITYRDEFNQIKLKLTESSKMSQRSEPFSYASISSRTLPAQPQKQPGDFTPVTKRNKTWRSIEDGRQIDLQKKQLAKCKHTNELDLHNFQVQTARETTEIALKEWWNDEIEAREQNGDSGHGYKAREVDFFKIITGRGIHSENGISKVRLSIKKWLNNSQFYFEDGTAGFIVKGLKKPT